MKTDKDDWNESVWKDWEHEDDSDFWAPALFIALVAIIGAAVWIYR